MFRRFMIVCWVLFAIPAIVSLVSWPMYYKYGNDIEALDVMPWERRFDPINFADEIFGLDDAPVNPLTEEQERRREELKQRREELEQRREKIEQEMALESKQESWGIAAFAGMGIAAAILLWNILCHTVAWVIAGRNIPRGGIDGKD